MNIEVVDKQDNKTSFILSGTSFPFVNTIRRIIMEEVPTMAIEEVEFRSNTSVLYDEIVAHRLGLTPLTTDLKSYELPDKCKCEGAGCSRCQLKLTLKFKGDIVYASELESKDPAVKPVYPETPITSLQKGQKIELEATAVLGRGKDHAKFSPGHVFYKYKPEIEIGNVKDADAVINSCPDSIFEKKGGKLTVNEKKLLRPILCQKCLQADPAIKLKESDKEFVFYMEGWGQLSNKEILSTAAKIFQGKLDDFSDKLKALR